MADDGMLMNFAVGDGIINVKPVFKGGNWKDRLGAKRSVSGKRSYGRAIDGRATGVNTTRLPTKTPRYPEASDEPANKRQKITGQVENIANGRRPGNSNSRPYKEVISSLFTYNPESKIDKPEFKDDANAVPAKPSNAPLIDGLDTFTSLGLSSTIAAHLLTKLNLKAPTAIQKSALEQLCNADTDAYVQAETGSGKTLAYLLPIIHKLINLSKPNENGEAQQKIHRNSGLFALILAPTRELCAQISVVLQSLLGCASWLVCGTVQGGEKKKSEKARLRKGLNILVATPGRLVDHMANTEVLDLRGVRWIVLDEGDRLMDLGFEQDIKSIFEKLENSPIRDTGIAGLPSRRNVTLCSATMKTNVQRLGELSLKDAVHIAVESKKGDAEPTVSGNGQETTFSVPAQLQQSYIICPPKQRLVTLAALLKRTFARKGSVMKAIVFVSCADSVDFHFELFGRQLDSAEPESSSKPVDPSSSDPEETTVPKPSPKDITSKTAPHLTSFTNPGLMIYKLHGSLTQQLRTSTLSSFSRCSMPSFLICTDVASRGLDLPSIDLVIEYDPAFSFADHLHRVGRTARAGKEGRATLFLTPGPEEGYIAKLATASQTDGVGSALHRTDALEVLKRGFGPSTSAGSSKREWEDASTNWQLQAEQWALAEKRNLEMARKAYVSHVRAYATHTGEERGIFDVKSLHLGHWAKAFALRDRPGQMGRGKESNGGKDRRWKDDSDDEEDKRGEDMAEAKRKMRRMAGLAGKGASEFNIG